MSRPRTPVAVAKTTGAATKQKTRFDSRVEPIVTDGIGDPFDWLNPHAQSAWREIVSEVPWLNSSHRGFLAIAATVRGRMIAGEEIGIQAMNLLRQCYGQMGATPSDSSKVGTAADGENKEPGEEFFED